MMARKASQGWAPTPSCLLTDKPRDHLRGLGGPLGRKLQVLSYLELGSMGGRAPGTTLGFRRALSPPLTFTPAQTPTQGTGAPPPSQGRAALSCPGSPHPAHCAGTVTSCCLSWAWDGLRSYGRGRGLQKEPLSRACGLRALTGTQ